MLKALRLAGLLVLASTAALRAAVLVSEDYLDTILSVSSNGTATPLFPSGSAGNGMAVNSQGDLYAGSFNSAKIFKYTTGGDLSLYKTLSGVSQTQALAFSGTDTLYVAIQANIFQITSAGVVSTALHLNGASFTGLAFNSAGTLFTSDYNSGKIYTVNTVAHTATRFGTNLVTDASVLAFNSNDELFVSNFTSSIYKLSADGSTKTLFANDLVSGWGLAFDSNDLLYAADYDGKAIYTYTTDGTRSTYATGINDASFLVLTGDTLNPAAVPEPSTWALFSGLSAMTVATIYRRRAARA